MVHRPQGAIAEGEHPVVEPRGLQVEGESRSRDALVYDAGEVLFRPEHEALVRHPVPHLDRGALALVQEIKRVRRIVFEDIWGLSVVRHLLSWSGAFSTTTLSDDEFLPLDNNDVPTVPPHPHEVVGCPLGFRGHAGGLIAVWNRGARVAVLLRFRDATLELSTETGLGCKTEQNTWLPPDFPHQGLRIPVQGI